MPTAAKLFSAIFYGVLTYVVAHLIHGVFEADAGYDLPPGVMKEWTAGIGAVCGWFIQGSRSKDGLNFAIQGGILTVVSIYFWGLTFWSIIEMVEQSMKLKYSGATKAVIDVFRIAMEYAKSIASPSVLVTSAVGSLIGGYLAHWGGSRFR